MLVSSANFSVNKDRLEASEKLLQGSRNGKVGIRTHNSFIGFILSIFGKATKMQIDVKGKTQVFYINQNSFRQWREAVFATIYNEDDLISNDSLRDLFKENKYQTNGLVSNFKKYQYSFLKPLAKELFKIEQAEKKASNETEREAIKIRRKNLFEKYDKKTPFIKYCFNDSFIQKKINKLKAIMALSNKQKAVLDNFIKFFIPQFKLKIILLKKCWKQNLRK